MYASWVMTGVCDGMKKWSLITAMALRAPQTNWRLRYGDCSNNSDTQQTAALWGSPTLTPRACLWHVHCNNTPTWYSAEVPARAGVPARAVAGRSYLHRTILRHGNSEAARQPGSSTTLCSVNHFTVQGNAVLLGAKKVGNYVQAGRMQALKGGFW